MQDPPLFLGIDVGTSGIRACVIDNTAQIVAFQAVPLPAPKRDGAAAEQMPDIWWSGVITLFAQLKPQLALNRIAALAVDGTSATVLLTDADNQPLGPALMYNDARAEQQAQRIAALAPTDSPAASRSAGLAKVLWLMHQPMAANAAHLAHQADWITAQFTRRPGHSDVNNCLKTGVDPITRHWPEWLSAIELPVDWLPQVHTPGTVIGPIHPESALALGLSGDLQIVAGTTDSHAAVLATGIRKIGEAVTSLGSTLVLKVISAEPVFSGTYGIYSQPFAEHWLVGGASNSGGAVLKQWFDDKRIQQLSAEFNAHRDTGLDYYPLPAAGERFPVRDDQLRPRLTPRPKNDALFLQGILEGIARIEQQGYRRLMELGAPYPHTVCSVGGGADNPAWSAIRQRYLQVPVFTAQHTEAAYGAAQLARQAIDA